jgi:hypothetical protein
VHVQITISFPSFHLKYAWHATMFGGPLGLDCKRSSVNNDISSHFSTRLTYLLSPISFPTHEHDYQILYGMLSCLQVRTQTRRIKGDCICCSTILW